MPLASCVLVCVFLFLTQKASVVRSEVCLLPELLAGVPSQEETLLFPACEPSKQPGARCTVHFPEGSVSYSGNITNSTALYMSEPSYCLTNGTESVCSETGQWLDTVVFEEVATEGFLQVWNIVLIVLGVLAFVIGDAVAAGLGMMLFVRSDNLTDKVISLVMLVVSIILVLPVAGPVALIMYFVLKKTKKDKSSVKMKWWYRILTVFSILLKLVGALLWLVQAGYSATKDFYGKGPLRDENGECVPHEPNTTEKRVQDALVILCHVVSILVAIDLHVKAFLSKKGTIKTSDDTDLGKKKPEKSDENVSVEMKKLPPEHSPSSAALVSLEDGESSPNPTSP